MLILTNLRNEMSEGTANDFRPLLDGLAHADRDDEIAAENAENVGISVYPGFDVLLPDVAKDSIPVQHLTGLSADEVMTLVEALEEKGVPGILEAAEWQPGSGPLPRA